MSGAAYSPAVARILQDDARQVAQAKAAQDADDAMVQATADVMARVEARLRQRIAHLEERIALLESRT